MSLNQDILNLCIYMADKGVVFDLETHLPEGITGQCNYQTKTIFVDPDQDNAMMALLTFAHEAGHMESYFRNSHRVFSQPEREIMTYLTGWRLIKKLGLSIDKDTWKWFHSDELEIVEVKT